MYPAIIHYPCTTLPTLPYYPVLLHMLPNVTAVPTVCTGPGLPGCRSGPVPAPEPGVLDGIIYLEVERARVVPGCPRGGFKAIPGFPGWSRAQTARIVSQVYSPPQDGIFFLGPGFPRVLTAWLFLLGTRRTDGGGSRNVRR